VSDALVRAPFTLETPRLQLVAPTPSDADAIFERYAGDADVTRYVGWPRHRTVADTRAFLAFSAAEWSRSPAGPYLIKRRDNGRLLGGTGLGCEGSSDAMTGYVLAKDAWGQGYATEALQAMVELSSSLGVQRLYAVCHAEHRASWHVLEKCAFTRDRNGLRRVEFPNLAPGVLQDAVCYERVLAKNLIRSAPSSRESRNGIAWLRQQ
jgi:RimJ/RimL family protein N-acetyltransferase